MTENTARPSKTTEHFEWMVYLVPILLSVLSSITVYAVLKRNIRGMVILFLITNRQWKEIVKTSGVGKCAYLQLLNVIFG